MKMNSSEKMFQLITDFISRNNRSKESVELFLINFYEEFDKFQKETFQSGNYLVDCRAGCSECCNHWVEDVYGFEAELILERVKLTDSETQEQIARRAVSSIYQFERIISNDPGADELTLLNTFYRERIPCPLLDENGLCRFYEVRPLTCRGFFSESFERYCSGKGDENQQSGTYMVLPSEKIQSLLDDIHLGWYKGFPTSLRSVLSFIT